MSCKIVSVGDVMLGENANHFGRGIRTIYKNNYNDLISRGVKRFIGENDILIYNFEYSLVNEDFKFLKLEESIYRAGLDSLDVFPQLNYNVVNIANNHFSQHGKKSARFTKNILREKGFIIIGEDNKPKKIHLNNLNVFLWGVSLIVDKNYCEEYFFSNYKDLIKSIYLPKKGEKDKWIISIHWGDEYVTDMSSKQKILAEKLSNLGFDIIYGHHPHVVQPFDMINKTLVYYSLGNFIFDQNFSKITQKGMLSLVSINDNKITFENYFTFQRKYKVAQIEKVSEINIQFNKNNYLKSLKRKQLLMRILMKLEVILNITDVDNQTILWMLKRFFNR